MPALIINVARMMALAETTVCQRMIAQIAPCIEILPDLCLPSHDNTREQVFLPLPPELIHAVFDRFADDIDSAPPYLGLNHLAVETHLRKNLFGLWPPVYTSSRSWRAFPVHPFDIVRVAP
jgi:hypothetical protein